MVDGSAAVIESYERILLQQRDLDLEIPYPGHWCFFGGHVDENEFPEDTLLRELKEELGKDFDDNDFNYLGAFDRVDGEGKIHLYFHQGEYVTSDFILGEGRAMAFVNPKYALRLTLCPNERSIMEELYGHLEG